MDGEGPWDRLAAEFRSLLKLDSQWWDPKLGFQIVFPHDDQTHPRVLAEQFGDQAVRLLTQGIATEACLSAVAAAHFAALVLKGQHFVGTAVLTGGSGGPPATKTLYAQFRVWADRGARLAGLVESTATQEEAVQAWCDRLRRRGLFYALSTLTNPLEASAVLCLEFGTPAFVDQAATALKAAGDGLDARALTFATWLDAALTARGWDEHDLQRAGGPYWTTTRKLLNGERGRGVVFTRVEKGLNTAKGVPKVPHEDIERFKREWRWVPCRKPRRSGDGK